MTRRESVPADAFGAGYLKERIDREFPLARHLGVSVESADDDGVALCAPLAPNSNYKGTAFGGSLFCVAVLAGWAWATRYIERHGLNADAVIQESRMRYLHPVSGAFRASLIAPPAHEVQRFCKMMARSGRGRIGLHVDIHEGKVLATSFDGLFAAAVRRDRSPASSRGVES